MEKYIKELKDSDGFELIIDGSVFNVDTVIKTAYLFLDKSYLYIKKEGESILVQFRNKEDSSDLKKEVQNFGNELLNTYLREKLSKENKEVRDNIITSAVNHSLREAMFYDSDGEQPENSNDEFFDKDIDDILKEIEDELDIKSNE